MRFSFTATEAEIWDVLGIVVKFPKAGAKAYGMECTIDVQ